MGMCLRVCLRARVRERYAPVCACVCMHACVRACVRACATMEKSARRMASTTSDTGDTSSKQQQARRKQNWLSNWRLTVNVEKNGNFGQRLFATHPHVARYILFETRTGDEKDDNDSLQRFGVLHLLQREK